jgi:hypothetical protein
MDVTWAIREHDKSRMSAEIKFMRMAKYMWKDYKTNVDILSELKMNPVLRKFKITEINGCNMYGEWTDTDCHT